MKRKAHLLIRASKTKPTDRISRFARLGGLRAAARPRPQRRCGEHKSQYDLYSLLPQRRTQNDTSK
jgi:hypothetical protein